MPRVPQPYGRQPLAEVEAAVVEGRNDLPPVAAVAPQPVLDKELGLLAGFGLFSGYFLGSLRPGVGPGGLRGRGWNLAGSASDRFPGSGRSFGCCTAGSDPTGAPLPVGAGDGKVQQVLQAEELQRG